MHPLTQAILKQYSFKHYSLDEAFFVIVDIVIELKIEEFNGHKIATAFHDGGTKNIVIFCHGYRGTSVGPNRFFVRAADKLTAKGISSLRFDQYGSGNSEGDFFNSSFNDWVKTTKEISKSYLDRGFQVALFGQSMGGATVIAVGSEIPGLTAVVAWVPDPNVEDFNQPINGYIEEGGQRVQAAYWQEAHDAKVADKLASLKAPAFIVQCTADEYVNEANRKAVLDNAQSNHQVTDFEGYTHSNWTYDRAEEIINRSVDFIVSSLR